MYEIFRLFMFIIYKFNVCTPTPVPSSKAIYLPSFSFCLDNEGMIGVLSMSNGLESSILYEMLAMTEV